MIGTGLGKDSLNRTRKRLANKTLKKYEEDFANELKKLSVVKQEKVLKDSKIANQVLASYSKSI